MVAETDKKLLFRAGRLSWKLHSGQLEVYNKYRAWEKSSLEARKRGEALPGKLPRIFIADCGRRFGKDFLCVLIRCEDALRTGKLILTYATALAKDITEIVIPLVEKIFEDAPDNLRPVLKSGFNGTSAGFHFHNGSVLRLVGIDRSPDSLRGRFSDGFTISECAFVDKLRGIIGTVIMPQLQGRLGATILLNSTPPEVPGHAWDDHFCPDALNRDAYTLKTIYDNPLLTASERDEFIEAAGGVDSENFQREYMCIRIRSATRTVIPEFNVLRHVKESPAPRYAVGYVAVDPAIEDLCAVVVGWWDFARQKLVIRYDWAERNANTAAVAEAVTQLETKAFGAGSLTYWGGTAFKNNPMLRVSDTDSRLITDLNSLHGIKIVAADKAGAEAALASLRNAFLRDKIEIHPDARHTIAHVSNAVWNKGRTSFERSENYGHFDAVDACKYLWRHVNQQINPNPPRGIEMLSEGAAEDTLFLRTTDLKTTRRVVDVFNDLMPKGWKTRR